jgi:hypothetical protein
MSLPLARITLRQHRFEVGVAILACLVVAAWALSVRLQLDGLGISSACVEAVAGSGHLPETCASGVESYIAILRAQGQDVLRVGSLLPIGIGLLVGVPLVGRELETGTAQTAWSLDASRVRWLRRRLWPMALVAGLAVGLAATATELLAGAEQAVGRSALALLGSFGLPLLARFVAALGIGLLAGSLVPRAVPASILGLVLCLGLIVGVSQARDTWVRSQAPIVHTTEPGERLWIDTSWAWQTPDGDILTREEAEALVPADVALLDAGDAEGTNAGYWLQSRGYERLPMGIPEREAMDWFVYEPLLYLGAGFASVAAAFVVVDRRRPT